MEGGIKMTVKELREKLAKLDDKTRVVVLWEEGNDQNLFDIDEVSISRGEPKRIEGKAGFVFDNTGPATWAFINVEPA